MVLACCGNSLQSSKKICGPSWVDARDNPFRIALIVVIFLTLVVTAYQRR
jgi:hypothetical protein